jgi:hypothetical protein
MGAPKMGGGAAPPLTMAQRNRMERDMRRYEESMQATRDQSGLSDAELNYNEEGGPTSGPGARFQQLDSQRALLKLQLDNDLRMYGDPKKRGSTKAAPKRLRQGTQGVSVVGAGRARAGGTGRSQLVTRR